MTNDTATPAAVRRLDTPDAQALADLAAIFEDLQTVLRCCERLVSELASEPGRPRRRDPRGLLDDGGALVHPMLLEPRQRHRPHTRRRHRDRHQRRRPGLAQGPDAAARPLRRSCGEPPGRLLGRGVPGRRRQGQRHRGHVGVTTAGGRPDRAPDGGHHLRPGPHRRPAHRARARRSSSTHSRR